MKRCPKCNRTFPTDTQRFCTSDGGLLVNADAPPVVEEEEASDPNAPTKVISRELAPDQARFDPFRTTIGGPPEPERTSQVRGRVTADLPAPPQPEAPRVTSAPLPPPPQPEAPRVTSAPLPPPPQPEAPRVTSAPLPPPPLPEAPRVTSAPLPPPPVSQPLDEATIISARPALPEQFSAPPTSGSMPISGFGPVAASAPPPPPPQPVSGSLATGSGPIGTPASGALAAPQFGAAQPQQVQAIPGPPPPKKSKLPLILGILAVLSVISTLVIVAAYLVVVRPRLAQRGVVVTSNQPPQQNPVEPPPVVENTPLPGNVSETPSENVPPPYTPPGDAVQFVNSSDKLEGKLAEHYVDFSFYYPERWQKDPKSGVAGASNFIEVHRSLPPNFTQESVAVSWYDSAGSFQDDQELFHSYVETKSAQFAQNIDEYRKVSEGPTKISGYDAYEFRFEGVSQKTEKGQFKIWGRVIWLPSQQSGKSGITLLMLATSLAPELQDVNDVGVKGELSMVLDSFRFGRPASP